MSSKELSEWLALRSIQPYGEERMDWLFAMVASVIANCHRDPKRAAFKVEDFLIFKEDGEPDQETLNQKIALMFGAPVEQ